MDKVLVTGAGGFIGSHVVDALVESGKRVTALDRPGVPIHRRDLRPIAAPIDDVDDLARACAGQDAVFHLAAVSDVNRAYADPVACVRECPRDRDCAGGSAKSGRGARDPREYRVGI